MVIIPRMVGWPRHVACMREMAYQIFIGKHQAMKPLVMLSNRLEGAIKIDPINMV
jgi:hypothetical protein